VIFLLRSLLEGSPSHVAALLCHLYLLLNGQRAYFYALGHQTHQKDNPNGRRNYTQHHSLCTLFGTIRVIIFGRLLFRSHLFISSQCRSNLWYFSQWGSGYWFMFSSRSGFISSIV